MLNLQAISQASLQQNPFTWAKIPQSVKDNALQPLVDSYPGTGFREAKKQGATASKEYHFEVMPLIVRDQEADALRTLPPAWREFISEFRGPAYRQAMQQLTGVDLSEHVLDIGFFRFSAGHWVAPHTDHLTKSITHVFYFNPDWEPPLGGCLRILKSNAPDATHDELPPLKGNSAVIVRSDQSWHMVTPVAPSTQWTRLTLQVEFWKQSAPGGAGMHGN